MQHLHWWRPQPARGDAQLVRGWQARWRTNLRTLLAFSLPLTLYILTLAPTIYNLDSAELTTAAASGGITRATGYPLYLLLGRLWAHVPLGDVGYRMNLLSAVCAALTVALAERVLRRWNVGPWASVGALGLLACAPYFWAMALIAEVYTLHTALMMGLLLALLRWSDRPSPGRLALAGLLAGLGLTHHGATVLLLPGCALFVLATAPRQALAPRALLAAVGALLAGLSIYLYLPLIYSMRPAFNYAGTYDANGLFQPINLHTLSGMWWLISGRAFAGQMLGYTPAEWWSEVGRFGQGLWRAFFVVGLGPGLLGLGVLLRRDWRTGMLTLLWFLGNALFYIDYRVLDKATMFLPNYVIWALWVGVGYQTLLSWVASERQRWPQRLLQVVMLGAALLALVSTWSKVDLSDDWSARLRGEAALRRMQPNALVFGWWDTVPLIEYLQLVEGQRPDVQAINRFLISAPDMQQLIEDALPERPVYIDHPSDALVQQYAVQAADPLYQLKPKRIWRQ